MPEKIAETLKFDEIKTEKKSIIFQMTLKIATYRLHRSNCYYFRHKIGKYEHNLNENPFNRETMEF